MLENRRTQTNITASRSFKRTAARAGALALALALAILCACGARTYRASVSTEDYSVGGAKWGATADEVKKLLGANASQSADGLTLTVSSAELCGQKAQARFGFVQGVSGTALNSVTFVFADGFDRAGLITELEKTLGQRDKFYYSAAGDKLDAPEENWYWHGAESVGQGGALKYFYKASFAADPDSGAAVLEIDATGYNISTGVIA